MDKYLIFDIITLTIRLEKVRLVMIGPKQGILIVGQILEVGNNLLSPTTFSIYTGNDVLEPVLEVDGIEKPIAQQLVNDLLNTVAADKYVYDSETPDLPGKCTFIACQQFIVSGENQLPTKGFVIQNGGKKPSLVVDEIKKPITQELVNELLQAITAKVE